jgi:hypothetical protein
MKMIYFSRYLYVEYMLLFINKFYHTIAYNNELWAMHGHTNRQVSRETFPKHTDDSDCNFNHFDFVLWNDGSGKWTQNSVANNPYVLVNISCAYWLNRNAYCCAIKVVSEIGKVTFTSTSKFDSTVYNRPYFRGSLCCIFF